MTINWHKLALRRSLVLMHIESLSLPLNEVLELELLLLLLGLLLLELLLLLLSMCLLTG